MARIGRNPNKLISGEAVTVHAPPPVSVGLLTEVRSAEQVADELQVVHLAVASARSRAGRPVHLAVIDNGSCPAMRRGLAILLAEGLLDQLVLEPHVADPDAVAVGAARSMPGPQVVCTDSHVCFLPDWLARRSVAAGEGAGALAVDPHPLPPSVARTLGARLRPDDVAELDDLLAGAPSPESASTGSWLWRRPLVQRAARRVHDLSFRVLYEAGSGE